MQAQKKATMKELLYHGTRVKCLSEQGNRQSRDSRHSESSKKHSSDRPYYVHTVVLAYHRGQGRSVPQQWLLLAKCPSSRLLALLDILKEPRRKRVTPSAPCHRVSSLWE